MLSDLFCARKIHLIASLATVFAGSLVVAEERAAIEVNDKDRRITLAGRAAKQNVYEILKGAIEYVAVQPGPPAREYESLFLCPVEPQALYNAMVRVGMKPGRPALYENGEYSPPVGGKMRLFVEWNDGKDKQRKPVEYFVHDEQVKKPMSELEWLFVGSREVPDPNTGKKMLQATATKSLISLHQKDTTVLIENPLKDANEEGRYHTRMDVFPKEGTPVLLIIEAIVPPKQPGTQRIHVEVAGKVQAVGFREFTQRTAKAAGLAGWVRNLPNGKVEIVAEGKEDALKEFQEKIKKGPRGAQVDSIETLKVNDTEILEEFDVKETPEK